MRIAHVAAPAEFGGLERVLAGLLPALASRGHEVMFIAILSPGITESPFVAQLREAGLLVEVHHVGNRDYFGERRLVRRLLREAKTEVVHTHGYRPDFLHVGVAHGLGLPVVSTAHGFASATPGRSFQERLQVWAWRHFDRVVAVSEPLEAHLLQLGVPRTRLTRILNGIVASANPLTRAEAREALGLPAEAQVVGWVGRLSAEKDPLLAVDALSASGRDALRLCFVGDGPLRQAVRERAATLGVTDRVHADGARAEAARFLAAFDALLLSSRTEGTPMTILEAGLAEVPIVATAVGGVPDVVGNDGLLVPLGDATALGAALDRVFEDHATARNRATSLLARLQEQSAANDWVAAYESLYRELCGRA